MSAGSGMFHPSESFLTDTSKLYTLPPTLPLESAQEASSAPRTRPSAYNLSSISTIRLPRPSAYTHVSSLPSRPSLVQPSTHSPLHLTHPPAQHKISHKFLHVRRTFHASTPANRALHSKWLFELLPPGLSINFWEKDIWRLKLRAGINFDADMLWWLNVDVREVGEGYYYA